MNFLLGAIMVIVGVWVVILGARRDLEQCHDDRQRSLVWTFTSGTIAGVMLAWLLVTVLPGWLVWLPWLLLLAALGFSVNRLQGMVGTQPSSDP